jgi:integrase
MLTVLSWTCDCPEEKTYHGDTFLAERRDRMSDSVRPPRYSCQKRKGNPDAAYTRISGKRIYLGLYGTPESKAKYARLIADAQEVPNGAPKQPTDPTVSELLIQFLKWAQGYYDDREYGHFLTVARMLRSYDLLPASEFGPKRLKEIRQAMIDKEWSRKSINRQVVRIRQIITWAVGEEIIPATNLAALQAVKGLREGRSDAKEKPPVRPVQDADIEATIKHLSPVVGDMVKVHRLIGCRPDEVCGMRPDEIDRSGDVWFFEPGKHKTAWRGKRRSIAIGPRAQQILKRYLFGDWCFDSGSGRYKVASYRRAIIRGCVRAKVAHWTPGRIRHTTATQVRKEFGLDSAQSVLGHSSASTTEIYAELDREKAAAVAWKIG